MILLGRTKVVPSFYVLRNVNYIYIMLVYFVNTFYNITNIDIKKPNLIKVIKLGFKATL